MTDSDFETVYSFTPPQDVGLSDKTSSWIKPPQEVAASRIPLRICQPQPTAEVGATSRFGYLHSSMPYEVPVIISGGVPPFSIHAAGLDGSAEVHMERPANNPGLDLWGLLKIPAGAPDGTVTITVHDQTLAGAGVGITLELDVITNDEHFVFVETDGSPDGAGTIDDPVDFAALGLDSDQPGPWAGRTAVLRAGTYSTPATMVRHAGQPQNFIGYPGEQVTIEWLTLEGWRDLEQTEHAYFKNLNFDGMDDNCQFIRWEHSIKNFTMADCGFFNASMPADASAVDTQDAGCVALLRTADAGSRLAIAGLEASYLEGTLERKQAVIVAYGRDIVAIDDVFTGSCSLPSTVILQNGNGVASLTAIDDWWSNCTHCSVYAYMGMPPFSGSDWAETYLSSQQRYCRLNSTFDDEGIIAGPTNEQHLPRSSHYIDKCTIRGHSGEWGVAKKRVERSVIMAQVHDPLPPSQWELEDTRVYQSDNYDGGFDGKFRGDPLRYLLGFEVRD